MYDANYVKRLEKTIKQFLQPVKNVPFNLVIESLSGKKVIPFDPENPEDCALLNILKKASFYAGKLINLNGIKSRRPNEVGNYIEIYVKKALEFHGLHPDVPTAINGKKKSAGYPDIIFYFKEKPFYLECKTFNLKNIKTTQRSFYFSPSENLKVIYDTHHFLLSFEMFLDKNSNTYKCRSYKLLSIDSLSVDVKHEFNSDNKRLYSGSDGAVILAEEIID